MIHGWGGVQTPFGLHAELVQALDPQLAAAAERLVELVMTFRTTHVQTLAILPELP